MGQFSWIDCNNHRKKIIDDYPENSYVLVPQEFVNQFGERITETCYDGYGDFGGYDIYDLVALWNREYIASNPKKYSKYPWFNLISNNLIEELDLRRKLIDIGSELRLVGIDIACYDEDNASLKYPIKITLNKRVKYEDCEYSPSDPNQGW